MKLSFNLVLLLIICISSNAQEILSLEKAIDLALENNYQIKIAKKQKIIAQENNHIGNAGLLPTLSINSNYNKRSSNLDVEPLVDLFELPSRGKSNTFFTSISLNYTLFAGMQRIYSLKNLNNSELLSRHQEKQKIEEKILEIINKYMEVANRQNEYELNTLNKEISEERFKRSQQLYNLGATTQIEMLNSEIDFNNDLINLQNSEVSLNSSKRDLKTLIGWENQNFKVEKNIVFNSNIDFKTLDSLANTNNASLKIANYNNAIAEQNIKLIQSEFYPKIIFSGSYFYSDISDNTSFNSEFNSRGFEGIVSLQFPLFNSNLNRKNRTIGKIEALNSQELLKDVKENISTALKNTYDIYIEGLEIIQLMSKNLEITHKNWLLSQDLYHAGQLSSIEYREAQSKLINIQIELGRLNYSTKIQEYILYQLAGVLIED